MIYIYRELYPGALDTENGRSLSCKVTWLRVNAINLRNAVLALKHHPWVGTTLDPGKDPWSPVRYRAIAKGWGKPAAAVPSLAEELSAHADQIRST